jgi:small-conductance mechanosensitive channel
MPRSTGKHRPTRLVRGLTVALHLLQAEFMYPFPAAVVANTAENGSKPTAIGPDVVLDAIQRQIHALLTLLPNFLLCAIFLLFVWALVFGVRRFVLSAGHRSHMNPPLVRALARLSSILVWVLGLFTAATIVIPSFNPGNMIAGLGISSIAIGFAFKDIFQNFLAGLLLLWSQPFHVGDEIKSGEFEGAVEDIDIRATLIRMYSGERAIVPNSSVYTNAIVVKTAFPARRGKIEITIEDGRPAPEIRDQIAKIIEKTPGVLADPAPTIAISSIKGSIMRFTVYLWSDRPLAAQDHALSAVRDAFEAGKAEVSAA